MAPVVGLLDAFEQDIQAQITKFEGWQAHGLQMVTIEVFRAPRSDGQFTARTS